MSSTDTYTDPAEALVDIRRMMSRSGRFLSLSGLSGVWAGACALVAAAVAYAKVNTRPFAGVDFYTAYYRQFQDTTSIEAYVVTVGVVTMVVAVAGAAFFTMRRARANGYALWSSASRSLLVSMVVPLAVGGLLVVAHWKHADYGYAAALTLIFYGLALLAGARYTLDELRALGYCEIALGVAVAFAPSYGIDAWALGFGVLHIAYGILMWWRYERPA